MLSRCCRKDGAGCDARCRRAGEGGGLGAAGTRGAGLDGGRTGQHRGLLAALRCPHSPPAGDAQDGPPPAPPCLPVPPWLRGRCRCRVHRPAVLLLLPRLLQRNGAVSSRSPGRSPPTTRRPPPPPPPILSPMATSAAPQSIAAPVPIPRGGHPAVPLRAADGTPGEAPSVQLNIAPNSNFFSSFIFFEGDANIGWRCGEGGGCAGDGAPSSRCSPPQRPPRPPAGARRHRAAVTTCGGTGRRPPRRAARAPRSSCGAARPAAGPEPAGPPGPPRGRSSASPGSPGAWRGRPAAWIRARPSRGACERRRRDGGTAGSPPHPPTLRTSVRSRGCAGPALTRGRPSARCAH